MAFADPFPLLGREMCRPCSEIRLHPRKPSPPDRAIEYLPDLLGMQSGSESRQRFEMTQSQHRFRQCVAILRALLMPRAEMRGEVTERIDIRRQRGNRFAGERERPLRANDDR